VVGLQRHAAGRPGEAALVKIAGMANPPKQFYAGSDAVAEIRPALEARLQEIKHYESLSKSTDGNY